MVRYYFDDLSSSIQYSTSWTSYVNNTGGPGAVYVVGDFNPSQRGFYCLLRDEGPWHWYSGSALGGNPNGTAQWARTRCAVTGLEAGKQYTLVFGQPQETVNSNGVTLDYIVVDNATTTTDYISWSSEFITIDPPADYAWSVANSTDSGSTSLASAAPSSTSGAPSSSAVRDSSSGGGHGTAVGVGVGVGVGVAAILALIAGWLFYRRRKRSNVSGSAGAAPTSYGAGPRSQQGTPMSAVGGGSEYAGGLGYGAAGSVYAPTEYQSRNGGVPEIQQDKDGVVPYYSASTPTGVSAGDLDNPATFSMRGDYR
ncbi:hypothetical protein JCM11641_005382 [Rhodosporidiobolus odoratus]